VALSSHPMLDIAEAIDRFYDGDTNRFAEGINEERKRYGWDKMTSAVTSLYKKTVENDY
jgi:hypothetical protein